MKRHAKSNLRRLEIGPGNKPLQGFEALNIVYSPDVSYILDASQRLPFDDDTYDVIFGSHVLEHIPWYQTTDVLSDWVRTLKPGGWLEIWVPNQLKVAKVLVDFEEKGIDNTDGWSRFNPDGDPALWFAGRTYTYGDGTGKRNHPNWHMACFTPRYLMKVFESVGLIDVVEMDISEARYDNHGWINLGVKGRKPIK